MPPKVQLIISIDQNGKLSVAGPMHDLILCFGMLEIAKEAIKDQSRAAKERVISTPSPAQAKELLKIHDAPPAG